MTTVLFVAERYPKEPEVAKWHDLIRGELAEHSADIMELSTADITTADGYVADLSQTSPQLLESIHTVTQLNKPTLLIGLQPFVGQAELQVQADQIGNAEMRIMSKTSTIVYLGMFLRMKLGLTLPVDSDVGLMPMDDPATRRKLRLTQPMVADILRMEQADEF